MYQYFPRPYPTPGTGNYGFDTGMTLPLFQVQGRGVMVHSQLLPRANYMIANLNTVYMRDVANGGLISGQLISQPLSQPAK